MTSDANRVGHAPQQLYTWVWLPGAREPVVAGVLTASGGKFAGQAVFTFTYARSYRERPEAMSLFPPELPLQAGTFDPSAPELVRSGASALAGPRSPMPIHGCLRDAAPDAWGRRVVNLRLAGNPDVELSELVYLSESGSNRIGALDFQASATVYVPRGEQAGLEQLLHASEIVEAGEVLPEYLATAFGHGTSIGGARPKALLEDVGRHLIAKFSSTTDTRPVVQAEAVAMLLAARAGIDVAPVEVRNVDGKDVLLVTRFDRGADGTRRLMLSALTILGLSEMESRYSSYADLADAIRTGPWTRPSRTLRELFARLVFNVCVGNNDDHLRNHAAFWDGESLTLTPAYDLAPQLRSTGVSNQAIGVTRDGARHSQLALCRQAAPDYLLTHTQADEVIDDVVGVIRTEWDDVCDRARLTAAQRSTLWEREFLNPYIFYDHP